MASVELKNKNGVSVVVLPFGAVIQKILLPLEDGSSVDVVQGYDSVQGYEADKVYYGCVAGRVANRISNAKFTLDGCEYKLPINRPGLCLHGGEKGFNKYMYQVLSSSAESVTLELTSPDGDQGFPGTVTIRVTYSLSNDNELHLRYTATTTKATVINLTNHSYFNLAGHKSASTLDHELQLFADYYLPKGPNACPTGEIAPSSGIFDFKNSKKMGAHINDYPGDLGIDHSFLVRNWAPSKGCNECKPLLPAARIIDPTSGRWLYISTNDAICHVYTGNYLDGVIGKDGAVHGKHSAFCIETQGYPDAPNISTFPSVALRPGELYSHHSVWKFGGF